MKALGINKECFEGENDEKKSSSLRKSMASNLENIAETIARLGRTRKAQVAGWIDEALELNREAMDMKLLAGGGKEGSDVADSLHKIGILLREKGQTEEAFSSLKRALGIFRQVHGENHPRVSIHSSTWLSW